MSRRHCSFPVSFFCNSNTPTSSCTRAPVSIRKRRRLSRHGICYWIRKYLSALEFSISSQTRSHSWKLSLQVSETSPLFSVHEKYQGTELFHFSSTILQSSSVTPAFITCWIPSFQIFCTFLFIHFFVLGYQCVLFWLSSSAWLTFSLFSSSFYCIVFQVKQCAVRKLQLWYLLGARLFHPMFLLCFFWPQSTTWNTIS